MGLGSCAPEVSLPHFYPQPVCVGPPVLCLCMSLHLRTSLPLSAPPTCLDGCGFFNSLIVGLPYSLIFWQFWVIFVLESGYNFCCGCARRWAVFTYASILTGWLIHSSLSHVNTFIQILMFVWIETFLLPFCWFQFWNNTYIHKICIHSLIWAIIKWKPPPQTMKSNIKPPELMMPPF